MGAHRRKATVSPVWWLAPLALAGLSFAFSGLSLASRGAAPFAGVFGAALVVGGLLWVADRRRAAILVASAPGVLAMLAYGLLIGLMAWEANVRFS